MPSFRLAHAWPGRHWPHTAASERAFVDELAKGRGRRRNVRFDRNDVTWLLTALRAGATAQTVASLAEGLNIGRLHAAYTDLDARRAASAAAWRSLCANPTRRGALGRYGPDAAKLLPVPVARLHASEVNLTEAAAAAVEEVARMHALSDAVSSMVERLAEVSIEDAQLEARRLWGPAGGCLWNDPYFLPRRVGELTPIRAVDLLEGVRTEELT